MAIEEWLIDTNDEMEIFARSYEDEVVMICFQYQMRAA